MNIYYVSQNICTGYDTYDSMVVCAESEEEARSIHPGGYEWDGKGRRWETWPNKEEVYVELLGTAKEGQSSGVMVASFNAG